MNNMAALTPGERMRASGAAVGVLVATLLLLHHVVDRAVPLVVVTVKTTLAHHSTRVPLLLDTWLGMMRAEVRLPR